MIGRPHYLFSLPSSVFLFPLTHHKTLSVRQISAGQIGRLVKVRGMVTRVSDVKPSMVVAAYTCESCGGEMFQEVWSGLSGSNENVKVKGSSFTPLFECQTEQCRKNKVKGNVMMQTRGSRFMRFQEAKIQEEVRGLHHPVWSHPLIPDRSSSHGPHSSIDGYLLEQRYDAHHDGRRRGHHIRGRERVWTSDAGG